MNLYTKYNRVISTSAVYSEHKRVLTFQNISQVVDVDPAVLDTDTRPGWGNEPSGTNTQTDTQTDTQNTHTHTLSLSLSLSVSLSLSSGWVPGFALGGRWRKETGAGQGVEIERCRVLEASGCAAVCANVCKGPTQVIIVIMIIIIIIMIINIEQQQQ